MLQSSSFASITAFTAVAAVLVLTPGVGTAFLMSTVIANGRRAGYLTAVGMVLGAATYAIVAIVGTAILLRAFPQALSWIAIAGGTFIIWLGLRGIIRAVRSPTPQLLTTPDLRGGHAFVVTGLLVNLSNVPLPLFYFVVVPQYIPRGMPRVEGALLLSGIHLVMSAIWMAILVTLVGRMLGVLRRPSVIAGLQFVTGLVLAFLGAKAVLGVVK